MLPIEIISHIARPVSLAMRLLGNIAADHAVVLAFFAILPWLLPLPFMLMGVFVSVVQTVVFSLLATVYIGRGRGARRALERRAFVPLALNKICR